MEIAQAVQDDLKTAMKAGDKATVGALRLLLSELQKEAKEGKGDELAVLRRERKRRLDSAEQFEKGGRGDLAGPELAEAEIISGYLPAELEDDELRAIVARAVESSGASSPADIGLLMKAVMEEVAGRADGKRVNGFAREALGA